MSRLEMPRKIHMKSVLYLLTLLITPALTPLAGDGTPPSNPVPLVDGLSPVSAAPGGSDFTLTVYGAAFLAASTVNWTVGTTTTPLATTFVSSGQLQATVPASLIPSRLTASVTVVTPLVGAASNAIYFPVLPSIPSVSFTATNLATGGGAYSLAVGDFNSDGLPDFAVTNNLVNTVSLFLSQTGSPGQFSTSTINAVDGSLSGPVALVAADFNNDGYLDLAVTNGSSNSVSVLLNNPGTPGTFTLAQSTTFAVGSFPAGIAAADFNGDGHVDLVVSDYNDHTITVLFNNAAGTPANFSAAPGSPYSVASNPNGIAVGDFNNDGYPDFAVTVNTSPGQIAVFLNNNGGTPGAFGTPSSFNVGSDPVGLVAADFDQDGKIDLAVANYQSGSVWVLPGDGTGSFSVSGPQLALGGNPYGLATADLNADGILDIAVTDSLNGAVDVFLGTSGSPGTFSATPLPFSANGGTQGVAIADFDGDGSLDIAASNYNGATATTLIQLPAATLLPGSLNFDPQLVNTTSTIQTATLTNTGSLPVVISSISVGGTNDSDFTFTTDPVDLCSGVLASGESCTFSVTFAPTAAGSRSATLSVADNLPGSPQTVSLTGSGTVPLAGTSPGSLNFVSQPVGSTSAAQNVTLNNTGAAALTISSIAVSGDFAETNNCGGSLAASGSCVISVTFTPTAAGARNGTLTVTDNSSGVSGSTQMVSIVGTGTVPIAGLSPSTVGFGNQLVGTTSSAQGVTLSNSGTATLSITGITITGANSNDFAETNTCGNSLAVGSNCVISVTFKPGATGARSATLTVTDNSNGVNSSTQTANLSGTGAVPVVGLSGSSLSFGNQLVGATSAAQPLTLTNSGTVPLTLTSITAAGEFAQSNTCGSSLAAGANCTISITFTPAATGTRSGTLTVTDNSNAVAGSQQTVSLTGNGAVPVAVVSTPSLTFDSQAVGSASGAKTVAISNNGTVALAVTSITVGGASPGDFVETNNCGASLGAGANCAISVTFKPTATGARAGTLIIADNSNGTSGSTQMVSLGGTGIPAVPAVALSTASLDFGYHMIGTNFGPKAVTVTNTGNAPLAISGISVTGGFTESSTCGTQLAAGASCITTVTFVPATAGVTPGTLSLTDNAAGSPHTVSLGGTGTSTPIFLSQPPLSTLSFGSQPTSTTAALPLLVANAVSDTLVIRRVIVAPRPMFQATGTCGTTIAPSQACTLVVSFTPAVPILYRGVLILFDNARPRPVQVYRLSGQGTGSGAAARTGAEDAISAPKGSVRSTAEMQAAVSPRTREVAPGGQQQGSMVLTGEAPESVGCEDLNAIGSDERSLDSLLKAAENCRL